MKVFYDTRYDFIEKNIWHKTSFLLIRVFSTVICYLLIISYNLVNLMHVVHFLLLGWYYFENSKLNASKILKNKNSHFEVYLFCKICYSTVPKFVIKIYLTNHFRLDSKVVSVTGIKIFVKNTFYTESVNVYQYLQVTVSNLARNM